MRYFRATEPETETLALVADHLLRELFDFGALSTAGSISKEAMINYMPRAQNIRKTLMAVQLAADLHISPGVPFVAHTGKSWPRHVSLAGFTNGTADDPRPLDLVTSVIGCWYATIVNPVPFLDRVARTLVYTAVRSGPDDALSLIVALRRHGQVTVTDEAIGVLLIALWRTLRTESRAEFVDSWAPGLRLDDPPDRWLDIQFSLPTGKSGREDERVFYSPERFIRMATELIKAARAVGSWDDWVISNHHLVLSLPVMYQLQKAQHILVGRPLPLALRTAVSQYEEITEDARSFISVFRSTPDTNPQEVFFVKAFADEAAVPDHESLARMHAQRLSWPAAVDGYASADFANLPQEFSTLSWRIAHPAIAIQSAGGVDAGSLAIDCDASIDEARKVAELASRLQHDEALRTGSEALVQHPWSRGLRWELAIALEGVGRIKEALDLITQAVVLGPTSGAIWDSMSAILATANRAGEARRAKKISRAFDVVAALQNGGPESVLY